MVSDTPCCDRKSPFHTPTPHLPVICPPLSPAHPESRLSSSLLVSAKAECGGGSVGGVFRGPAPAPAGPAPTGSWGCGREGFYLRVCM